MGSASANPTVRRQLGKAVQQNKALSVTGMLERMFAHTFTGLVYAQIWEDPVVDMDALAITPADRIVTIASGGCNVMSYLTRTPASIEAVDLSPAHVALNRLKYAAARHLPEWEDFFAFFGRANDPENTVRYDRHIARHLDPETRAFWEAPRRPFGKRRITMFEDGFYRFGALGQFISWAHRIAGWNGVDFAAFMRSPDQAAQVRFFEEKMLPALNSRIVRFLASNRASLFGLGIPPQQYEALAGAADGDIHAVLVERTRALMCDHPLNENYFAWAAFNRGYDTSGKGPLPPYLTREAFETIKEHAPRASIRNRTVTDFLGTCPDQSRDCYVLLDAQDWMNDQQLNDLWREIMRTARPGARVIYRTAGIETILPGRVEDAILSKWSYDGDRSKAWHRADRSAIYGGFHLYTLDG